MGVVRRMRNFLALGFVVIKLLGLFERVEHVELAVQQDGGDLECVGVSDDGVVSIRLHGACIGCPSSEMTLKMGIEENLKAHVPEITGVMAVD